MIHITPNDIPSAMNDGILIPELRDIMDAKIIDNMFQNALDKIQFMEARRMCEKAKMEIFIEDGQELLDEGNSVIFFVNFHESVNLLRQAFPDAGVITGKDKNRDEVESNFQSDKIRTLICTSQAGGTSINLHDTNGLYPRVSLISPSFDANELIQVLGRTKRAGGKTPAIWKIIFAGGTVEERAYKTVKSKVKAIDTLTDGDLVTFEGIK
jgi:ERCC4-related helicase